MMPRLSKQRPPPEEEEPLTGSKESLNKDGELTHPVRFLYSLIFVLLICRGYFLTLKYSILIGYIKRDCHENKLKLGSQFVQIKSVFGVHINGDIDRFIPYCSYNS